jgi:hypothetical protein
MYSVYIDVLFPKEIRERECSVCLDCKIALVKEDKYKNLQWKVVEGKKNILFWMRRSDRIHNAMYDDKYIAYFVLAFFPGLSHRQDVLLHEQTMRDLEMQLYMLNHGGPPIEEVESGEDEAY